MSALESTAIVLFIFGIFYFSIRFIILTIITKGSFVKEKIFYDDKGNPRDILRVEYNYFWGDTTTLKWHPKHQKKTILKFANDPTFKYIADQIDKKGFWKESDGIPLEVIKASRKYREENE